jgi:hypothetical protein
MSKPKREGIYGSEIVLGANSGEVLRVGDEVFATSSETTTNAYHVWVGAPVLVVSQGVERARVANVAGRLRDFLGVPHLAAVVELGWLPGHDGVIGVSDDNSGVARRDLARAQAYALVQGSWFERERVLISLDEEVFDLKLAFEALEDGTFCPVIQ